MASKADMQGWFKVLEKNITDLRITQYHHFNNEVIKKVEQHSGEIYFFFESGKWAKVGYHQDDWGDTSTTFHNEISLRYDLSIFRGGGIISKPDIDTADKFYKELDRMEYDDRDRKEYERLKRKFESQ